MKTLEELEAELVALGYDLDELDRENPFWPAGYEVVRAGLFGDSEDVA